MSDKIQLKFSCELAGQRNTRALRKVENQLNLWSEKVQKPNKMDKETESMMINNNNNNNNIT